MTISVRARELYVMKIFVVVWLVSLTAVLLTVVALSQNLAPLSVSLAGISWYVHRFKGTVCSKVCSNCDLGVFRVTWKNLVVISCIKADWDEFAQTLYVVTPDSFEQCTLLFPKFCDRQELGRRENSRHPLLPHHKSQQPYHLGMQCGLTSSLF